ncbi:hypothetical protein [Arthrobacter sp.]|uniref:hypothetical protein n=1 Tax=Arthrobacter sp. TaxID=1667 RepID=UPI003A90FA03
MTTNTLERPLDTEGFTLSRIKEGDMAHAMITLSRQYSRPKEAVIRELSTNALESHQAAGHTGPVEVKVPSDADPFLTVTDHGLGLGLEDIADVVGNYADSTKRHDGQATPNYGIGSKSPFAVSDHYTVIAIKDGVRREVLFARLPDGNPGYKIVSTEDTGEANGVTVRVPVVGDWREHGEWLDAARDVFYWWERGTYRVDADTLVSETCLVKPSMRNYREQADNQVSTDIVRVLPATMAIGRLVTVRTGTTGHSVPARFLGQLDMPLHGLHHLVVELPKDSVKISPNRESIEDTEGNRELVHGALREWAEIVTGPYLAKLEAATSSYNLYRAWDEASDTERVLTGTRWFDRVGKRYDKTVEIALKHIRYPKGGRRTRETTLGVSDLAEGMSGRCLVLEDLDTRSSGIITDWRRANGYAPVYVFKSPEDVRPFIDPDEVEWATLEDLKTETPSRKAKPLPPLTDADRLQKIGRSQGYGQPLSRFAVTVGLIKEKLADGLPLVIGVTRDFEGLDIDYAKAVAITRGPRTVEAIEAALEQKSVTPHEHVRATHLAAVAGLDDDQKQIFVERATVSHRAIQRAYFLASTGARDEEEFVCRYSEAVLEAVKPLAELESSLDPAYASLPGMPEPRLNLEFRHTITLLDEISSPSELLLKMALRADKMAAGDRKRRGKRTGSGTK